MYNRHPTLPIVVKYNLDEPLEIDNKNDEPFYEVTFQAVSINLFIYQGKCA